MFERQWRALVRAGMFTEAGSLPAPQLHREVEGLNRFFRETLRGTDLMGKHFG